MRIDGVPGAPQPMDGSEKGKGKRSAKIEKYPGEVFIHTRGKDVDFETFIEVLHTSIKGDNARGRLISRIKELVKSGRYSVDTEKLARKMIDSMGGRM